MGNQLSNYPTLVASLLTRWVNEKLQLDFTWLVALEKLISEKNYFHTISSHVCTVFFYTTHLKTKQFQIQSNLNAESIFNSCVVLPFFLSFLHHCVFLVVFLFLSIRVLFFLFLYSTSVFFGGDSGTMTPFVLGFLYNIYYNKNKKKYLSPSYLTFNCNKCDLFT